MDRISSHSLNWRGDDVLAKVTYKGPVPENDPLFKGGYELFSTPSRPTAVRRTGPSDAESVVISSTEYWVKIVEFLQQNWALVDEDPEGRARICFITDSSGMFDELVCCSINEANDALIRNRFLEFSTCTDLQSFLRPPPGPFHRGTHPNGPIYSSGRFWL